MDDDQQFCLRWNNHQSTLVAVFDTLLENGTLVDCTLAAEGKFLNAHKVVLSACSPYFESLLSRHFDKHPILILKDVKFQELKAMMDYMYRGEVNISQDQLGALLKAAESLQIKGLSDNRKGETERKPAPAPPPPKSPQPTSALPKVQGLTIEQRSREDSREGSMSPGPRKKKRLRRKSEELDNHDASNSSESHSLPAQNIPSSLPAVSKINADVPEPVETKSEILRHKQPDDIPQVPIIKEKIETHTELMLEPKSEYVEEMNEDSIEDLTLDDDDLSNMEQMDDQAGPSHGNAGEGSSQGFGGWHMGNQSQDEVFLAAQEAVGAHRDSQDTDPLADPFLKVWTMEDQVEMMPENTSSLLSVSKVIPVDTKKKAPPKKSNRRTTTSKWNSKLIGTDTIQRVSYCDRNGKLVAILRCLTCGSFVQRGQQYCKKCLEGTPDKPNKSKKSPGKNRKIKINTKVKRKSKQQNSRKGKDEPKKVNRAKKPDTSKSKPKTMTDQSFKQVIKSIKCPKIVKHDKVKRFAELCFHCKVSYVRTKGSVCRKCSYRIKSMLLEDARQLNMEPEKIDTAPKSSSTVTSVSKSVDKPSTKQVDVIEIADDDDENKKDKNDSIESLLTEVGDDPDTHDSDYYVSLVDINKMLDD